MERHITLAEEERNVSRWHWEEEGIRAAEYQRSLEGGDHDVPYSFAKASSPRQVLAWMRLLAKVQRGELEP